MSRYAEGTKVSVESSRGELSGILAKHGVVRQGWFSEPEADTLQFELKGGSYRLTIIRPTLAEVRQMYPNAYDHNAKLDQEWRRRWRAHVLLLKAKLEFADGEASSVARELLPYRMLASGITLEQAIADNKIPLLAAKT
jgi:hypothetical protein